MYNIRLAGLDTGREYYVKVRAKVLGYETSEWTPPFKFSTPRDTMPPGPVGFLRFVSEGDSFLTNWAAPTVNADGSPCADVAYYNVKLENLDTGTVATDRSVDPSYPIDLNKNASLFGTLAGKIEITITAVDLSGNEGIGVSAIAQNPPPSKVQNVTASVGVESVGLKWDENTESDLANYEIHVGSASGFTPSSSTLRAKVAAGTNTHTYDTASLTTLYFKIIAVDKFNQKSIPSNVVSAQPRLTTDYDKTPPGVVAGVTVTQSLAPDNANAVAKISYTGLTDADLDKYEVQYRKTGETIAPWSFTSIPSDQTSAEIKPLPLSTSYDFRIRAVDFNSNKGAWSSVVVAPGVKKTTLPAAPTGVTVRGGMSNLMVTWTASTDVSMSNWAGVYEVQISKASTFTTPTTIKTSSTLASFINLDQNTVYYVRVRAIDPYKNTGSWSSTANGNTGIVADANASRVIWSETEPVDGKTNDLWIKIPDNVQYRFDGTTWVTAQDTTILAGQGNKNFTADVAPTGAFKEGDTWMQTPEYVMHVYKNGVWTKAQDTEVVGKITKAQNTADGKNKVWYQTNKPPITNNVTGDTWFDTANGNKLHVWSSTSNDWVSAQDAAIQDALDEASDALTTADGKNKLFFSTPTGTIKEGDTWFDGPAIKQYRNGAWVNASDALDTKAARDALNVAGSKNKTFYTSKASATGMIAGDILFDTADGNKQYRYSGSAWVSAQDAAIPAAQTAANTAQQTADKKNTVFFATPAAGVVLREGDTWFDGPIIKQYRNGAWVNASDDLDTAKARQAIQIAGSKNKTYYVAKASATGMIEGDILFDTADGNKQYRYSGSAWVSAQDASIAAAASAAGAAQTTADKKNTIYYATPPAGAVLKDGDVWFDGAKIKTYRGTAWVDSSTNLTTKQAADATTIASGKNKTYYTTYAARPTTGLTAGDLLFDTADKYKSYRYNGTAWEDVRDGTIKDADDKAAAAQTAANAAKTAAELRAQTFYEATGPANTNGRLKTNDLWIRSSDNQLHRWTGSAWVEIQDDAIALTQSNLTTAVGNLQTSIGNVQAIADGKINSFIGTTAPTQGLDAGDIWFDTSVTPVSTKVYDGTNWVVSGDKAALDAAAAVQTNLNATNTALNKKNTTYAQTAAPTANLVAGDIWLNTTLVSGVPKNEMNRWSGSAWVKIQDKTIFDVQALADGKAMVFTKATMPTDAESDIGDIWFDTSTTPWGVKVRTGAVTWTISGDKAARDAAQTAQTEANRKIQSFYTDTDPATVPANNVKAGDLWYKVNDKRGRVRATNNTWVELKDTAIDAAQTAADNAQTAANTAQSTAATAVANASTAFNLADGKANIFWQNTEPTGMVAADKGDIWVNTEKTPNEVNAWSGTAWTVTGDPATKAIADAAQTLAGTKAYTYFGGTKPTSSSTPKPAVGDIWINTAKTPNEVQIFNGTAFVIAADADARTTAASKAYIYTTTNDTAPTSPAPTRGDVWINTTSGKTKIRSATAWVDSTDPEARDIANSKITTYYNNVAPTAPTGGFTTGDLWVRTTDNRIHRWAGSWTELKDKSITDLEELTDDIIDDLIPGLETQLDKKIEVYVQDDAPAITDATKQKGDIWIRPANGEVKVYSGTAWVLSADPAAKALANTAQTAANNANTAAGNAQTTADKKMQTFYASTGPANNPAGTLKVNDLWIHSTTKRLSRWNGTIWEDVKDADITAAQNAASAAQSTASTALTNAGSAFDLADKKAQIFYGGTRPTNLVATDKGDIWVDQSKTPNEIQSWTGTAWVTAGDPGTKTIADAAQLLAAQKAYVYTQTTEPTASTVPAPTRGDTWIHTTTGETKIYSGTAWVAMTDPAAQTIANRKITTYYGTTAPTAPSYGFTTGDLWVNTALESGVAKNRMNRWSGSAWVELKDASITAVETTANSLRDTVIPALATQVDNKIEITVGGTRPSFASATAAQRAAAKGDMHIDTTSGLVTVYAGTANDWTNVKDPAALTAANNAAALAGTKRQVFGGTTAPANTTGTGGNNLVAGDLWLHDTTKRFWKWSGTTWEEFKDTAITAAQAAADAAAAQAATGIANAQAAFNLADGKAQIFRRTTAPTGLGAADEGDIWVDTSKTPNETKMWTGTTWVDADAATKKIATDAATLAGTKSVTFVQPGTPTGMVKGDIWINTTAGNNYGQTKVYSGSAWVDTKDVATSDLAKSKAYIFTTTNATPPTSPTPVRGDVWINTGDGKTKIHSGTGWVDSTDPDARNIANQKTTVYYDANTPATPKAPLTGFVDGDMWVRTTDNRVHIRTAGTWKESADTSIKTAQDAATSAMDSANARNRSFFSTGNATGTTLNGYAFINGDMWYKKDANNTIIGMWEFVGGAWVSKTLNNQVIANLDAGKINAGTISADRIGANSLDATKIVVGGMDGSVVIKDGTITADELGVGSVIAGKIATGAVEADKIKANAINATHIISEGIDGTVVIKDGTLTATQIAGKTITGDKIVGNTIDATHIKAGSIVIGAPDSPLSATGIATPTHVSNALTTANTNIATAKGEAIAAAGTAADSKVATALTTAANTAQAKADAAKTAAEQAAKDYADGKITTAQAAAISAAATDAQTKATAAKDAAIAAAASDATTKAGNAKTEAITTAGTNADGKISTAVAPINTKIGGWSHPTNQTFIDGGKIYTDSITAGQIAANAIGVSELAANAVTADKVAANSISAQKLVIGTAENMVNDPNFIEAIGRNWQTSAGFTITAEGTNASNSMKLIGSAVQQMSYNLPENSVNVEAGAKIRATVRVKTSAAVIASKVGIGLRLRSATGVLTYPGFFYIPAQATISAYKVIDLGIIDIPTDGTLSWYFVSQVGSGTGTFWFDNISVMRAVGSTVIADDAITAGKIAANAVTAGTINANAITSREILAGSIKIGTTEAIAPGTVAIPSDVTAAEARAASDATTKANNAKSQALTEAANTAQSKADAAALAAKNAAQDYADGKITTAQATAISTAATEAAALAAAARTAAENTAKGYTDTTVAPINTSIGTINTNVTNVTNTANAVKNLTDGWKTTGYTTIDGGNITTDSIKSAQIDAKAIKAEHIDGQQITTSHVAVKGLVGSTVIADGTITTLNLNAKAVTAAKIATDTIVVGNIAPDAIDNTVIKDGAITTNKILAGEVKTANLDASAVTADKIAANSISAQKLIIGLGENFVNDPNFVNTVTGTTQNWSATAGITIVKEGTNGGNSMKIVGSTAQQTSYNQPEDSITVEADAQIRVTMRVKSTGTIPANTVGIGFRHKSTTGVVTYPAYAYIPAQSAIAAYKIIDLGIIKIPTDGTLSWFIVAQAGYSSRTLWVDNVSIMRAVGSTTIADNAITTGKIAANAVTANEILAGSIKIGEPGSPIDKSTLDAAVLENRTKDYGFAYKTSITLYGDHDKYYPVGLTDGDQNVDRQIMILRSYGELHPPEWYSSTHGGGLQLVITANYGGWGGVEYKQRIDQLSQQYNDTLGDIRLVTTGAGIFVFLRGGGTTGAKYNIYSDQPVEGPTLRIHDAATATKLNKPFVFYNAEDYYVGGPTYTYKAPAPLTEPNHARIKELSYVESAKSAYQLTNNWVATGTTTIDGGKIKTDSITSAQIAAGAITVGSLAGGHQRSKTLTSAQTGRWVRIASNPGNRAAAKFTLKDTTSGRHQLVVFDAGMHYGTGTYINLYTNSGHSGPSFSKIRLLTKATYDPAFVEVFIPSHTANVAVEYLITENYQSVGWGPEEWIDGVVPTGYTVLEKDISIDNISNLVQTWQETGTTMINGGHIKADTIEAGSIKTGQLTIGHMAPNQVATPSQLASTTTSLQTYADTKKSEAITAAGTAADGKVTTALVPINSSIGTINTNVTNVTTTANNTATTLSGLTALQGGVTVIDGGKIKTDSITALQIATNAITVNELAANSVVADSLTTNMLLSKGLKIQSSLEINHAGGHIKSSNYNDANKTGFYMDQQQLIVHNGRIEAAAIKLQDSSNIMPPTYASFNARESAYAVANMWTSSVSGITKFPADGKFGGDSLQAVITANTGFIGMGHNATDLNIPIDGGKQYIISFYVSNRSSKVITLQPELYQTASIFIKGTATSIANSTAWTRYSMFVTAPATMTRAILRFNLTVGATATFRLDGIQVEQKIGQETEPSNWSPPGFTSIDGESITTGEISSNATVNTGNGAIAKWSINTQGDARFGDVTVDGQLIVGKSANTAGQNANVSIKSDNYVAGLSGWSVKGNGDAEFNNGTFRGTLNLTKADLTMTAAVSPIKVYTTPTVSSTVDVANIQGVTYAYSRVEDGDYYKPDPTQIRADKKARFFIGPTTDRAVNIQVHDKDEVGAVFLEDAPDNVIITSLNIGEQTDASSQPSNMEDQGVTYSAKRIESKNYVYWGQPAEEKKTVVATNAGAVVKLRSPYYPERMGDIDVYPRSTHIVDSEIRYEIPNKKNLLPGEVASGWSFPAHIHTHSSAVRLSPELKRFSGNITGRFGAISAEPFQNARQFTILPFPNVPFTLGRRYIVSFYMDTQDAIEDYYVGALKGPTAMIPTEGGQTGTLPSAPNFYATTAPGDYFKLNSGWANTGSSKFLSDLNNFNGSPTIAGDVANFGPGQRARATNAVTSHFATGGTVSVWFRPYDWGNTGPCTFYHRGTPSSVSKEMWLTFDANREALNGGIAFSGTARTWASNINLERNKWHHIAVTVGPSATNRTFRVYINGLKEIDTTFTSITGSFDLNQFLYLGSDRNGTQDFNGQIGDVAHWNTALSDTQIAELYATPRSMIAYNPPAKSGMTLVESGQSAKRVSFYTDNPLLGDIRLVFATASPSKISLYGFQVEEAAYKNDTSLPLEVRNSGQPTAWSVSNLQVDAKAGIEVDTHPIANFVDYIDSTKFLLPDQRSEDPVPAPAEIKFNVSSSFSDDFSMDSIFSSDLFQSEAEYRITPRGMVYPGSNVPFLPTAMTLRYDFSELSNTSKPRIGGTGYMNLLLNSPAHGNVRVGGAGVVLTEGFNGGSGSLPSPWQAVNLTVTVGSDRARLADNPSSKSEGEGYAYHGRQLSSADHDVSVIVRDTTTLITYSGIAGPVISIDPVKGDRISLVLTNGANSQSWKLIAHKSNVKTILLTGTRSAERSSSPRVRLVREGDKLTGYYNNTTLFTQTFSVSQLPQNGKYTGFTGGRGGIDNFRASLAGDGGFARGIVQPYSININNGRGLQVFGRQEDISGRIYQPGDIYVLAPGYYNFSVISVPSGRWGTASSDWYRYSLQLTDKNGNVRNVPMHNAYDMYSPALGNFTASLPAYAEGKVSFILETNDASATYIDTIEINIVRLA